MFSLDLKDRILSKLVMLISTKIDIHLMVFTKQWIIYLYNFYVVLIKGKYNILLKETCHSATSEEWILSEL